MVAALGIRPSCIGCRIPPAVETNPTSYQNFDLILDATFGYRHGFLKVVIEPLRYATDLNSESVVPVEAPHFVISGNLDAMTFLNEKGVHSHVLEALVENPWRPHLGNSGTVGIHSTQTQCHQRPGVHSVTLYPPPNYVSSLRSFPSFKTLQLNSNF